MELTSAKLTHAEYTRRLTALLTAHGAAANRAAAESLADFEDAYTAEYGAEAFAEFEDAAAAVYRAQSTAPAPALIFAAV